LVFFRKSRWTSPLGEVVEPFSGRRVLQSEALASDGGNPFVWQSGYGIETRRLVEISTHHGLATQPTPAGKTRFHLSQAAARSVCGWLFLARLSLALPDAEVTSRLLDTQDYEKQGA
jgi:hypothetical protein